MNNNYINRFQRELVGSPNKVVPVKLTIDFECHEIPKEHLEQQPDMVNETCVAWLNEMPGMVCSGKTKEEAFEKLMVSLKVKLAYDNQIDIRKHPSDVGDKLVGDILKDWKEPFLNWYYKNPNHKDILGEDVVKYFEDNVVPLLNKVVENSSIVPEVIFEEIHNREKTEVFPNSVYKLYTKSPGDLPTGGIIAVLELIYAGNLNIQEGKKYQLILKEV